MFFICGINSGQKELPFSQMVVCPSCGSYGRYQVYMTYMCLSLFFIPVLKWGRRYFVKMSCCEAVYQLDPEVGRRIAWKEQVEIASSDLRLIKAGKGNPWRGIEERKHICGNCGYETQEDFAYCPKCGRRLG